MNSKRYSRTNSHSHEMNGNEVNEIFPQEVIPEFHSFDVDTSNFTVKTRYTNLKSIGSGSQGKVVEALDIKTGNIVAIKKISCYDSSTAKYANREIVLLQNLAHDKIIEMHEIFTSASNSKELKDVYIVMNKMDSNMSCIKPSTVSHAHISYIIFQLLLAVKHIHSRGIVHRDIKPQNIGLMEDCQLKLLDFGLSRPLPKSGRRMSYNMVTLHYRAPEILLGLEYSKPVDMWSVGCILAELLNGRIYFQGEEDLSQLREIMRILGTPDDSILSQLNENSKKFYKYHEKIASTASQKGGFNNFSIIKDEFSDNMNELAEDLLKKILVYDPTNRITAEDAIYHPYFKDCFDIEDINIDPVEELDDPFEDCPHNLSDWKEDIFNKVF